MADRAPGPRAAPPERVPRRGPTGGPGRVSAGQTRRREPVMYPGGSRGQAQDRVGARLMAVPMQKLRGFGLSPSTEGPRFYLLKCPRVPWPVERGSRISGHCSGALRRLRDSSGSPPGCPRSPYSAPMQERPPPPPSERLTLSEAAQLMGKSKKAVEQAVARLDPGERLGPACSPRSRVRDQPGSVASGRQAARRASSFEAARRTTSLAPDRRASHRDS